MTIREPARRQRGQAAAKYPLKRRIAAWTLLVALGGVFVFILVQTAAAGRVYPLIGGCIGAALVAWRSYRQAQTASSR